MRLPYHGRCPECQLLIQCLAQGGCSSSKKWHFKSRHPELDIQLINAKPRPTVVAFSSVLPLDERGWERPLCKQALPVLPEQDPGHPGPLQQTPRRNPHFPVS